jgi:hypothetical protein
MLLGHIKVRAIFLNLVETDNQGASVALPVFARLYPAKPRTARPIAIITQVEGSGTVAWKLSAEIEENSRAPPEVENGWSATKGAPLVREST